MMKDEFKNLILERSKPKVNVVVLLRSYQFVFQFGFLCVVVTLIGDEVDPDFGIDSVIAIPIDQWSLDYVTPSTVCVRKNGECIKSEFPNPPQDSKVIPFTDSSSDARPAGILDEDVTSLFVDESNPIVDVNGNVPKPGLYVLVAQYYQPDKPSKK